MSAPTSQRLITEPRCSALDCDGLVDGHVGGVYCAAHRYGLELTASLADALGRFLAQIGVPVNDNEIADITEAGECVAAGLGLLIGAAFGNEIAVDENPIRLVDNGTGSTRRARWRIDFQWRV